MSDYSIITFLKSLAENNIEKQIFELFSKNYNDEELLDNLLTILKGDNDD